MRTLEQLVQQRRMLVHEVGRITNRLSAALKEYFPQVLDWFKDKDTLVFCDFLTRWPTLKQAQRARKARLCAFFHEHNVRYPQVIEKRVQAILAASPLTTDPSVIGPHSLLVSSLTQQLRVLLQSVQRFDAEIATVAPTLPDYELFAVLPGAGPVFAPRLLAAFGEQRERFQNANQAQSYFGLAPVTERSGNKCWVHWRLRCPKFVRQTFVEWAALSIPYSFWAGHTGNSATRVHPIKPRYGHWPSNGFASSTAAGRPAPRMTRRLTSMRSSDADLRCSPKATSPKCLTDFLRA